MFAHHLQGFRYTTVMGLTVKLLLYGICLVSQILTNNRERDFCWIF